MIVSSVMVCSPDMIRSSVFHQGSGIQRIRLAHSSILCQYEIDVNSYHSGLHSLSAQKILYPFFCQSHKIW